MKTLDTKSSTGTENPFSRRTIGICVTHEDGTSESVSVRQIRLSEYHQAAKLFPDEFPLVALACDRSREWIETLVPESFNHLQLAMRELNSFFFAFAERSQESESRVQKNLFAALATLPPEMVNLVMAVGSKAIGQTLS